MFCGAWVYFRFILACKNKISKRKRQNAKKRQFPRGWGDGRPSGLSHSFFLVTNLWKNVCGPFITQGQQTYKFIVEKIDWKKVRCLGWSRMLWILEIRAEFLLGCSLNLQKQQAKVEESCPKLIWDSLQKMLDFMQKIPKESLRKVSKV
jgi:hypothetical protein